MDGGTILTGNGGNASVHTDPAVIQMPYLNTIPADAEPGYPGDTSLEDKLKT